MSRKAIHYKSKKCRSNVKNTTSNIDEVTCLKCIDKMEIKPKWFIEKEKKDYVENKIKRLEEEFIPLPSDSIDYKIGDMVYPYNSSAEAYPIEEIYCDGKYYLINNSIQTWIDIKPVASKESKPLFNSKRLPRISYSNSTLQSICSKKYSFGLNLDPYYQRGLVWSEEQKVSLIDSIFKEVEIGRFLFIDLGWQGIGKESYEVVDGKQRLSAIFDFIENKFKYKGLYYKDLCKSDVRRFNNLSIVWGTLHSSTTKDELLEIFVRLNTHGVAMDKSHLEKVKALMSEGLK